MTLSTDNGELRYPVHGSRRSNDKAAGRASSLDRPQYIVRISTQRSRRKHPHTCSYVLFLLFVPDSNICHDSVSYTSTRHRSSSLKRSDRSCQGLQYVFVVAGIRFWQQQQQK